ncbi:MAG: NADH-quinone oxidoreductase subunit L, partial [Aquificaceae bacterium]|nr:NADH-quinone oxidoreductase subunit L [Aquificaceae bacterium]
MFILLYPLIAFLIISAFGSKVKDFYSWLITLLSALFSSIFSAIALWRVLKDGPYSVELYSFLPLGEYSLSFGLYFDHLSASMAFVVSVVATLIFAYSLGYMHHEENTYRFYAFLSLFLFAMMLIVLSDNLLGIFFGWEGVGLASYSLIGYYYKTSKASKASFEAFILNRVGDWLFLF